MPYLKFDGTQAAETGDATASTYSTSGADTMTGTTANEAFWLAAGDIARGGAGNDTYWLQANKGQFTVVELAGQGTDKVAGWQNINLADYANIENVYVAGDKTYGAGNAGDNIIEGGAGSQQLYGGGGQDVLIGGTGADVFIVKKGEGNDAIQDFSVTEDRVRLSAGYTTFDQVKAHMTQVGNDVKLDLGGSDALIFRNVTVGQFTAANFQLQLDYASLGAKTFADEFNGALSLWDKESNPTGTWRTDFGYQGTQGVGSYTLVGNDEKQVYTSPFFRDHNGDFAETPFVSNPDGTLSIWAKPSTNPEIFGYGYTSGMITTQPTFAQTYGYFEMKADLPSTAGAWPAFWLIPADGSWPPELDVMETLTSDPNGTWTTEHSGLGGTHTSNGVLSFIPETTDGMHTYGVLWTSTDLVWYIDGVEVFHTATPADMNKPMFMIANLALGGWGGAIDTAQMPAELKIDYIRAYTLGSGTGGTTASTGGTTSAPPPTTTTSTGGTTSPPPPTTITTTPPAPITADPGASTTALVLTSKVYGDTLSGGAGGDTLTAGQGPDKLTGGTGADTFVFKDLAWTAGHITDFQVGVDKLDVSALLSKSGYTGTDPVADGYVKLIDNAAGGTWVYFDTDGVGAGDQWGTFLTTLDGVSSSGLTWAKLSPAVAPPPAPAPVVPALTPGPLPSSAGLNLTSVVYGDTLTGGAYNDTLTAGNGADKLTGGAGSDTFSFKALPWTAGHITDFQVGVDKLDLSALFSKYGYKGADPVKDGYVKLVDNNAGGTWLYFDTDGKGNGDKWGTFVTTIDGVKPTGLTWAKLAGPTAGKTLTSSVYGDTLTGGVNNDTLVAGNGPDALTGGAGSDRFTFKDLSWTAGHITDFQHNVDKIDVSALLAKVGYNGGDPIADGYVKLIANNAGGTWVYFDTDGKGAADQWGTFLTTVDNVAPSTLTGSDWIFA